MAGITLDLVGISGSTLVLNLNGPQINTDGTNIFLQANGGGSDVELTASVLNASATSGQIILNSAATGSGSSWITTIQNAQSGQTAAWTLTLPASPGSPNQVLQTDGSGTTSWVNAGSTSACVSTHMETIAFGATSPVTLFTLPADAVVHEISVIVDVAFTGGTGSQVAVGVSGTTSKFAGAGQSNLGVVGLYKIDGCEAVATSGTTQALIATYSANSATAGSARVITKYSVPAA